MIRAMAQPPASGPPICLSRPSTRASVRKNSTTVFLRRQNMQRRLLIIAAAAVLLSGLTAYAQRGGRGGDGQAGPPPTAKAAAPMDITGYWVSLVTDNWIFRVITPAKGDY